jgi:hypothetical protein
MPSPLYAQERAPVPIVQEDVIMIQKVISRTAYLNALY